jgi:hypothetical protein
MNRHWCAWCGVERRRWFRRPGDICATCRADHRWFEQRYGGQVVMLRHPMPPGRPR